LNGSAIDGEVRVVKEVLPGVLHWSAPHSGIKADVSSYFVLGERPTLIDPLLLSDDLAALREPAPAQIVITNRHHLRSSERIAAAFGCPIRCNEKGLHEFAGGPPVEGFAFGDELAPGIRAHEVGVICDEETALHLDVGARALVVADGIINYAGIGFVPDVHLGDDPDRVKRGLKEAYARLLELDFDNILFAHGEPLIGGAKQALREFVES